MGIRKLCIIPEHNGRITIATTYQIQNERGGMKRHPDRMYRIKEKGSIGSMKPDQPWATVVVVFLSAHLNQITKNMEASSRWTDQSLSAPGIGKTEAKLCLFQIVSLAFEEYNPLEKYLWAKLKTTFLDASQQNAFSGALFLSSWISTWKAIFFGKKKDE